MKTHQIHILLIIIFISIFGLSVGAFSDTTPKVWFWYLSCGDDEMVLEISFDSEIVYKTTFPICALTRSEAQSERKTLIFYFESNRSITWDGYRDDSNTTQKNQKIEGNVWLAGSEQNGLILGVSFSTEKAIYMNTLHFAEIGKKKTSEIEPGLVVSTYPTK